MIINRLRWVVESEFKLLKRNFKKEINFLSTLSFKDYLNRLVFPEGVRSFVVFLRCVTLYVFLRFFFDVCFFILWVLFNFYYIVVERIFSVISKVNALFFLDWLIFGFNEKWISRFRSFFLCLYFVNLSATLKKRRIPLYYYIFEQIANKLIRRLRRRRTKAIRKAFRRLFWWTLIAITTLCHFIAAVFAFFIDLIVFEPLPFFRRVIGLRIKFWIKYFLMIRAYRKKGVFFLNDNFLFHVSNELKRAGFNAPVCTRKKRVLIAKIDYRRYRRRYRLSGYEPDYIDRATLDVYIYLKDLLINTRFQRKKLGYFEIVPLIIPFALIVRIYFFIFYFFVGCLYLFYFYYSPYIVSFCLACILFVVLHKFYYVYCLCSKDVTEHVIRMKRNDDIRKKLVKILNRIQKFYARQRYLFDRKWHAFRFYMYLRRKEFNEKRAVWKIKYNKIKKKIREFFFGKDD